jgi:hypothetical protein
MNERTSESSNWAFSASDSCFGSCDGYQVIISAVIKHITYFQSSKCDCCLVFEMT